MGGYLSTRWNGIKTNMRMDYAMELRINHLIKRDYLKPGQEYTWTWTNLKTNNVIGKINIKVFEKEIVLDYYLNKRPVIEHVDIDFTPCNYGGQRKWFLCPECGERVISIYCCNGLFKCRHCHKLTYYTSSKSRDVMAMIDERITKIVKRLKADHRNSDYIAYGAIPTRPKGMHLNTYNFLIMKMRKLHIERSRYFISKVGFLP